MKLSKGKTLNLSLHKFKQPKKTLLQKFLSLFGKKTAEECVREAGIKGRPERR